MSDLQDKDDDKLIRPEEHETESTEAAVDDIVQHESDALLEAEDKEVAKAFEANDKKTSLKEKIVGAVKNWWNNKKARYITLSGVGLFVVLLFVIPPTRYFILNNVGVRCSVTITVLDEGTKQPLKNVQVRVRQQSATTDINGKAKVEHTKLGRTEIVIEKRAFAELKKNVTLGWGSNPQDAVELKPVGARYIFTVKDWQSDKPVKGAEAASGEYSAVSDEKGEIVLTVDASDDSDLPVNITAKEYRTESVVLGATENSEQKIKLVPARKDVFVSKRSGKYDLYKVDVDGKNEEIVLKASGTEQPDIGLSVHPTKDLVALVSTRENARNSDGFLLSTLSLVDIDTKETKSITKSERLQLLGWTSSKLVYAQVVAGASAGNPQRQKIISYDLETGSKKDLAASNSFNDMVMVKDEVFYAATNYYNPDTPKGLFKVNADGSNKKSLIDKNVWTLFRSEYTKFDISQDENWYTYTLGESKANKQANAPANQRSRSYVDSPDGTKSLWVDERDGKGVLLVYNVKDKTDKILKTQSGIAGPVRWLSSNSVLYRVQSQGETADYVLNVEGGGAQKVRDVTTTSGIERWYYY